MSSRLAMIELSIVFPIKDAPAGTMVTVYQRMGSVSTACPGQTDCNQFVVYVGTDTGPGSSTWFSCVNPMWCFTFSISDPVFECASQQYNLSRSIASSVIHRYLVQRARRDG